jgi:hypothetical protein
MKPEQPIGKFDDASGEWVLCESWLCRLSGGRTLYIRAGFVSDGASVPRFLWPVVGPRYAPATFAAALAHDAMYAAEIVSRADADNEFHRLLIMRGVGRHKACAYWLAVRLAGWAVWARHTPESVADARRFVSIP